MKKVLGIALSAAISAWPCAEAAAREVPTDKPVPVEAPVTATAPVATTALLSTTATITAAPPAPVVATLVAPSPNQTRLLAGTEVALRLRTELTTKEKALKVGDRFDLETVDPLMLGNLIVLPAGTRATGEITTVRNKGMWGKSGRFEARLLHLKTQDRNIRLAGTFNEKGSSGGWGAVGATLMSPVILPIGGFFVTGTSARLPAGAIVKSYLDEDIQVVTAADPVSPTNEHSADQPAEVH